MRPLHLSPFGALSLFEAAFTHTSCAAVGNGIRPLDLLRAGSQVLGSRPDHCWQNPAVMYQQQSPGTPPPPQAP